MLGHSLHSRPNHCLPSSTTNLLVSKGTGRSRWPWNRSLGFHTGVHKAMGVVAMIPSSYTANGCQAIVSLMVPWWLKCLITQQVCRLNSFSANDLLLINAHLLASKKTKGSIGNDKIILFFFLTGVPPARMQVPLRSLPMVMDIPIDSDTKKPKAPPQPPAPVGFFFSFLLKNLAFHHLQVVKCRLHEIASNVNQCAECVSLFCLLQTETAGTCC